MFLKTLIGFFCLFRFRFFQQPTGSAGNLNELFSGLLTTNQQQQQPMRINQLNLADGYAGSNLIEQSKAMDFCFEFFPFRHFDVSFYLSSSSTDASSNGRCEC